MGKGIALSLQAGAGGAASDVEGVDMVSMVYGTQPVTMCPKGESCSVLTYTLACSCPCVSALKFTSELPAIPNANPLHINIDGCMPLDTSDDSLKALSTAALCRHEWNSS